MDRLALFHQIFLLNFIQSSSFRHAYHSLLFFLCISPRTSVIALLLHISHMLPIEFALRPLTVPKSSVADNSNYLLHWDHWDHGSLRSTTLKAVKGAEDVCWFCIFLCRELPNSLALSVNVSSPVLRLRDCTRCFFFKKGEIR
jgi:hypothetical protein